MQIPHTHISLLYYTVINRYWPTHVETPVFRSVIWHLAYELRSVRNLHHQKDLFLASRFEYNLDMVWIRGSEVIGCQSPKILTPDLAELRDHPLGPPRTRRVMLAIICRFSATAYPIILIDRPTV